MTHATTMSLVLLAFGLGLCSTTSTDTDEVTDTDTPSEDLQRLLDRLPRSFTHPAPTYDCDDTGFVDEGCGQDGVIVLCPGGIKGYSNWPGSDDRSDGSWALEGRYLRVSGGLWDADGTSLVRVEDGMVWRPGGRIEGCP